MAIANIFGRDFYQGTDAEMAACVPRIDGALFWTTDTLKLYCYSGAAWNEVGGGAGGDVATDAIWDAKGDLAVGTGANTASKLSVGADGKFLKADSGEATGLAWDNVSGDVATDDIWDAKGDIAAGTGANTAAKLTVGADGKMLYADSGEATGLKWDDPPAGTDVATDAIWDAKGDLAVGTGADTAAKLTVGADGKMLYADSGEATGLKWDDAPAGTDVATDAIWDAKGDLAVGTGANTASKLTVGTDGQVLTADSGEATGVKWYGGYYDPDVPPASPGAYDDEFDDDAIDGAWSYAAGDDSFSLTQATDTPHISESIYHGYLLIQADTVSKAFTPDITQAFTLVAKIHPGNNYSVNESWGKLYIEGQSSSYYYEVRCGRYNSTSDGARTIYNNGAGAAEAGICAGSGRNGPYYAMIIHDGSKNFSSFTSSNGLTWNCIDLNRSLSNWTSFAKVQLAIPHSVAGDSVDGIMAVDFLRYFTTAGVYKIGKDV